MNILPKEFYRRDTKKVAKNLLWKILVKESKGGVMKGKIVETEAYYGEKDPASHAFKGKTPRNKIMWGKPGRAYVYFTYGMHFLLNAVTGKEGKPRAVLIRALEPLQGIEAMKKNRGTEIKNLTNGPGKLTQALGITKEYNGRDLAQKGELYIEEGEKPSQIISTTRVGINAGAEKKWRFYIKGNKFVSQK